jgi:branched-subunit amino acid transport protein
LGSQHKTKGDQGIAFLFHVIMSKSTLALLQENSLIFGGLGVMLAVSVKGLWHAHKGEQLKSNNWAQVRSALGVCVRETTTEIQIATVVGFGIAAYWRSIKKEEQLELKRREHGRPRDQNGR